MFVQNIYYPMAQKTKNKVMKSGKVGYSATAEAALLERMVAKAHDMRIPFTKLVEGLMRGFDKTGKGYVEEGK